MQHLLRKPGLGQLLGGLISTQTLIVFSLALTMDEGQTLLMAAAVISLTVALATLWLLNRSLIKPLGKAAADIRALYSGEIDRNRRLETTRWREFKTLAESYNSLADRLQPLLEQVDEASGQITQAAAGISAATSLSKDRLAQQQQEAASIGNNITAMAATVSEVTREASEAAEHVSESDKLAQEGKEVMTNAIGAVMTLSSDVAEAATVIADLDEKSHDINAVLDMINSVAEQTNLLALNAAIEAARAGEAGRGFAVVADEVRSLAARTQESTANIKSIIQMLQASVAQASSVIKSSSDKTGECEEMVEQATITFAEIVGSVESLKTANKGISSAAEQQRLSAGGIGHSMDTISNIALEFTDDARQITHCIDALSKTAGQLNVALEVLSSTGK
jgi:methyl-accepting chemotaxis protein